MRCLQHLGHCSALELKLPSPNLSFELLPRNKQIAVITMTAQVTHTQQNTQPAESRGALDLLVQAMEGISGFDAGEQSVLTAEHAKILLLHHIGFLLSNEEARTKLAFGDHLIVYFSSLPCRLLAEAAKDAAPLLPDCKLLAQRDRLYLSLKQGWRERIRTLFSVPDKWFVRLNYSPSLSFGLPEISAVTFDKAVVGFLC